MAVAPDGVGGPSDSEGFTGDDVEHAAISAAIRVAAVAQECPASHGVNVGGVTSVCPAMMWPMLSSAGLPALQ